MIRAFAYLGARTARNWTAVQLRRLRRPRYLIGAAVGIAYFAFLIFGYGAPEDPPGGDSPLLDAEGLRSWGALALVLLAGWWWLVRADAGALAFAPSEVGILFPSPLTRSHLILYRLARGQPPIVFNALLMTGLFAERAGPGSLIRWFAGTWILLSVLQFHRLAAALTRLGIERHGRAGLLRLGPAALLVLVALATLVYGIVSRWPATQEGMHPREYLAAATEALQSLPAATVLAPFRAVLAPISVRAPELWPGAAGVALLILLAHLLWVVRVDAAFEEAAAAASARRAQLQAAVQGKRDALPVHPRPKRSIRLPLAPAGRPEVAILWKNMLQVLNDVRPIALLPLLPIALVPALLIAQDDGLRIGVRGLVGVGALMLLVFSVVAGPFMVRNDLRYDLSSLRMLRTYPLPGERLVTMEVLSSSLLLAAVQVVLLAIAFVASLGVEALEMGLAERVSVAAAALLVLPVLTLLAITIQNGAALLFPGWVASGGQPGGVEMMGQGIVTLAASVVALTVLMLGPVMMGGLGWWAASSLGAWAAIPAAALTAATAAMEAWLLIQWLGSVLERTDPAEV